MDNNDIENFENKLDLIKFVKIRENSKAPYKKHSSDAGYDLSWCPSDLNQDYFVIKSGSSVLLETGLKFEFPPGYVMEIKNRSSIASKKQLIVGACVVDCGYRNEVFVNLINVGQQDETICNGDRIAQFVIYKIESPVFNEVKEELLSNTDRGMGGFGSTNNAE